MRGGALPPALLFAALGLSLAVRPSQSLGRPACLRFLRVWQHLAFAHFPELGGRRLSGVLDKCDCNGGERAFRPRPCPRVALALSLNAGVWASAVVHLSGIPT